LRFRAEPSNLRLQLANLRSKRFFFSRRFRQLTLPSSALLIVVSLILRKISGSG
jgi:hypothetical protein